MSCHATWCPYQIRFNTNACRYTTSAAVLRCRVSVIVLFGKSMKMHCFNHQKCATLCKVSMKGTLFWMQLTRKEYLNWSIINLYFTRQELPEINWLIFRARPLYYPIRSRLFLIVIWYSRSAKLISEVRDVINKLNVRCLEEKGACFPCKKAIAWQSKLGF